MSNKKPKTLVIGAGLIGTSIAMGLVKAGYEVFIDDSDVSATDLATTRSQAKKFAGQLVDLIVVATPPSTVAQVIREVLNTQPTAVVTDVASVKGSILTSLNDLDQQQLSRIVGGHPMAGREVSGAAGAQNNLFVDRSWVVTKLGTNIAKRY
jgi:prephenate dehydrogenase